MKNDIWVSVIIPAYNAEKYLNRCIDAVINQNAFEHIEVLVVDDGSIDKTGSIADEYSKKYENIHIFHIKNGGVSNARNMGIEKARGKYVAFLDADDWVEPQFYSEMYQSGMKEDADVVASGILFDTELETIVFRSITDIYRVVDKKSALKYYFHGDMDVHVVNKVYRKELLENHRFVSTIQVAEDRLFLCECLLEADRIALMPQNYYHYYQNSSSVMNQNFSKKNFDSVIVAKRILNMVKTFIPELVPYAECMCIADECRIYGELIKSGNHKVYVEKFNELKKDIQHFSLMKCIRYSSKKHVAAFILAKYAPYFYNKLRGNTKIKFGK